MKLPQGGLLMKYMSEKLVKRCVMEKAIVGMENVTVI